MSSASTPSVVASDCRISGSPISYLSPLGIAFRSREQNAHCVRCRVAQRRDVTRREAGALQSKCVLSKRALVGDDVQCQQLDHDFQLRLDIFQTLVILVHAAPFTFLFAPIGNGYTCNSVVSRPSPNLKSAPASIHRATVRLKLASSSLTALATSLCVFVPSHML